MFCPINQQVVKKEYILIVVVNIAESNQIPDKTKSRWDKIRMKSNQKQTKSNPNEIKTNANKTKQKHVEMKCKLNLCKMQTKSN